MSGMKLLISDDHGAYLPQEFGNHYGTEWLGITQQDLGVLLAGPEEDEYWDAWSDVCMNAEHVDENGNKWTLYQAGDLWGICEDLMTDEEYYQFYDRHRDL